MFPLSKTAGLVCGAAIALLAGGCAREAATAAGIKGGDGVLRVGMIGEPRSLNPNVDRDELALVIGQNVFGKLVALTSDGNILPDLAERWEESSDGLTYTFHLRRGIRWHDGRAVSAEDVRATLTRVRVESVNRDVGARIASVSAPDPYTVVVQLTAPWAAFIPALGSYGTAVLPSHVYGAESWRGHRANMEAVGSGPFRLKSWERGKRVVLEKNPDYFGPGPYVDTVEYLVTTSPAAAEQMLRAGEIDLIIGRPPVESLSDLKRTAGIRVATAPSEGRTYLAFNMRRAPFSDRRVREAVNRAIDRRALIDRALLGVGTPALGFYTPTIAWAYNPAARVPSYDPAAARRLLSAAAPSPVAVSLLCAAVSMRRIGDEVAAQLARIGMRVRVEAVPTEEYLRRSMGTHDFDLAILSGSQGPDPDTLNSRFSSSGGSQVMGYANPELDAVLRRASTTVDTAVRAREYFRAQEILAADLPIAPLVENVRISVSRDGLRGLPYDDARGLVPEFAFNLVRVRQRDTR